MSIEQTVPGGKQLRRTATASLITPYNGTYRLSLQREMIIKDDEGNVVARGKLPVISVIDSQLTDLEVQLGELTLTGAQVMEALAEFFDELDRMYLIAQEKQEEEPEE